MLMTAIPTLSLDEQIRQYARRHAEEHRDASGEIDLTGLSEEIAAAFELDTEEFDALGVDWLIWSTLHRLALV